MSGFVRSLSRKQFPGIPNSSLDLELGFHSQQTGSGGAALVHIDDVELIRL